MNAALAAEQKVINPLVSFGFHRSSNTDLGAPPLSKADGWGLTNSHITLIAPPQADGPNLYPRRFGIPRNLTPCSSIYDPVECLESSENTN